MREYLHQRYKAVGLVTAPLAFAALVASVVLQYVAWIPWWALEVAFPIAVAISLVAVGRIRCPRCHNALGIGAQAQTSPRDLPGIGITRYTLHNLTCPHCALPLAEPI